MELEGEGEETEPRNTMFHVLVLRGRTRTKERRWGDKATKPMSKPILFLLIDRALKSKIQWPAKTCYR